MIAAFELRRLRLPLLRSHVYAGGEERVRDLIVVCAHADDGRRGWGECSTLADPGYGAQTTEQAWASMRDDLAPRALRSDVADLDRSMAGAALQEAMLDRALRADGLALVDWLAVRLGPRRASTPWCAVVGMDAPDVLVERASAAVDAGAAQVKVKIAPGRDVEPLRAVRTAFPQLPLAADANGSYGTAAEVPRALEDVGLVYLEQPLGPDDLDGAATLARQWSVPIALDESLTSVDRLATAIAAFGGPFVASIKVGRLGGVEQTVRALRLARDNDIDCFVGGMLESAVGRSIALAVALQAPCTRPTDAGPTARYFDVDIGPAFETDPSGALTAAEGPGIGFNPNRDVLDQFSVDRVVVKA